MAIKATDPSIEYNYVYMRELTIAQSRIAYESEQPIYTVSVAWDFYKVVDGNILYSQESVGTYYEEDFHSKSVMEYLSGDNRKINSLAANQAVVAQVVAEITGLQMEIV